MRRLVQTVGGSPGREGRRFNVRRKISRPIGNANISWATYDYSNINDTVLIYGPTGDNNAIVADKTDSNMTQSYLMQPIYDTLRTIYQVNVNVALSESPTNLNVRVSLSVNNTTYILGNVQATSNTTTRWAQLTLQGASFRQSNLPLFNESSGSVKNPVLSFTSFVLNNNTTLKIYAAYMEVIGI